jgi:CHAD domain-containing protein
VLKPRQRIPRELERIAAKQLDLALQHLGHLGDAESDDDVHEARRHVKKTRALMRLVRPSAGRRCQRADAALRRVNHLLAPIADGEAMVDTVGRLGQRFPKSLPPAVFAQLRAALLKREFSVDRDAARNHVLERAAALLKAERAAVAKWDLSGRGFSAIAPGFRRSYKQARHALILALKAPTAEHLHHWRRRVKDLWLEMRLIKRRCRGLGMERRRLAALDDCLGEIHNCMLLTDLLRGGRLTDVARSEQALVAVQRYEAHLYRRAAMLGSAQFAERPHDFIRRVRKGWRPPSVRSQTTPTRRRRQ